MLSLVSKEFDLEGHFAGIHAKLEGWSGEFSKLGFVRMDDFIPEMLRYVLELEVLHCLREVAKRRDIQVSSTGNSPRKYMSCSRDDIFSIARILPAFYEDPALYKALERIAGEDVIKIPFEPEEIVINSMQQPEDELAARRAERIEEFLRPSDACKSEQRPGGRRGLGFEPGCEDGDCQLGEPEVGIVGRVALMRDHHDHGVRARKARLHRLAQGAGGKDLPRPPAGHGVHDHQRAGLFELRVLVAVVHDDQVRALACRQPGALDTARIDIGRRRARDEQWFVPHVPRAVASRRSSPSVMTTRMLLRGASPARRARSVSSKLAGSSSGRGASRWRR